MKRSIAVLLTALTFGATAASAQEVQPAPARVMVTIIPAGGMFFTEGKNDSSPSFGNYDLGGGVTVNLNRFVGIEGEVSGALGVSQSLTLGSITADRTTPNILNYSGNVILSAPNRTALVPYLTGGIGGLSLFEEASLGIASTETFLTGNVGGGVVWHAGRWGVRGDYRFVAVRSKDDAPAFFGTDTRYGHRVYAGLVVNAGR